MKHLDRHIISRLVTITIFVTALLICIFILIDFSENSDDFADQGAPADRIWNEYYLNYIPEMIRLVSPVAAFIACLFLTGRMTERFEIIALKASGVSLYRLLLPYLIFAAGFAMVISYLDAFVIPESNAERSRFEQEFLGGSGDVLDRGSLYRQDGPGRVFHLGHYSHDSRTGYRLTLLQFNNDREIGMIATANRISWVDSLESWTAARYTERHFSSEGYRESTRHDSTIDLNVLPRDLSRRTSDIYQLTYPQAANYIESIQRLGVGEIGLPLMQFYGRVAYPVSLIIITLIGFALASQQRKGGRGFFITMGLTISFIYLSMIKIIEPFGASGVLDPAVATALPHLTFLLLGIILFITTKK